MVPGVESGRFKFHVYIYSNVVANVVGDILMILGA